MNADVVQFLRKHPLLQGVPSDELEDAATNIEIVHYSAGTNIIKEGTYGEDALFVMHGFVQVFTRNLIGRAVLLAELGPGNIIGEIGLLIKEQRTASVRANTDVTVLRLERSTFDRLVQVSPMFYESLKVSAEIRYVHALLRKASIWAAIPDAELRGLAEVTVRRPFKRGDVVYYEGENTEMLYLVTSGRFAVSTNGKRKAVLGEGDFFGEIALLADVPHTGTVVALENGELLLVGKQEFTYVVQQYPPVLLQFAEVLHIRRADLPLSQPFLSIVQKYEQKAHQSDEKLPKSKPNIDIFAGKWLETLLGFGALFVLFSLLAAFLEDPIWKNAALFTGALVGPITYVVYLRNNQLLGFGPSKLTFVFIASAVIAIPLSWSLERLWLYATNEQASFTQFHFPLAVAFIEEAAKLLICGYLLWRKRYRFLMDAIVFGAAAGMGFAAVETVVYGWMQIANESTGSMLAVVWIRALLSPFGHGTWTAIAAGGIWFGLHGSRKYRWLAVYLPIVSIGLHTLWNYDTVHGFVNVLLMLSIGVVGLFALFMLIRKGQMEEQRALLRINPIFAEMLSDTLLDSYIPEDTKVGRKRSYLYCEACDTQLPLHARYCARCGQSLRLKRI